jgi:hypothetical protein
MIRGTSTELVILLGVPLDLEILGRPTQPSVFAHRSLRTVRRMLTCEVRQQSVVHLLDNVCFAYVVSRVSFMGRKIRMLDLKKRIARGDPV